MGLKNFLTKDKIEAGCDEAGRGCLAGPVVAASVILPRNFRCPELDDSKKLSLKKRLALREIIEKKAITFAVSFIDHEKIDEINILNASFLAMTEATKELSQTPELLLIDGNRFKSDLNIPFECIIKGDGKFKSIAAAAILAKTYRDEYMEKMHNNYPDYDWISNKGYPTKKHKEGIKKVGLSPIHRLSFKQTEEQLKLDF
ncbi:ribonuclease HII [Flavobacteriales bacterium]|nr:ribonuclease HII [Flavobacteriales bacterium]